MIRYFKETLSTYNTCYAIDATRALLPTLTTNLIGRGQLKMKIKCTYYSQPSNKHHSNDGLECLINLLQLYISFGGFLNPIVESLLSSDGNNESRSYTEGRVD